MARKQSNPPGRGGRSAHNSIVAGMVIGLLLGLLTAVAVLIYWYRAPSPFANRAQPADPVPPAVRTEPLRPAPPEPPSTAAESTAATPPKGADKPRFDFYEML